MKKKLPLIAILSFMMIGVCIILYPIVSAFLAKMTQSTTIKQYKNTVNDLSDLKIEKMKAEAHRYNESLYGAVLSDPFDGSGKNNKSYSSLISVNEVLGYIEIPKIKVYLPIYYGTTKKVLENGVGLMENTSLPVGGESTHAVLSGHRGLPSATLFTDLDQMEKGDVFYIHVLDEVLAYQVDQIKVILPEETSDLTIVKGKDYITLITCTPYGVNTHRLLIRGVRIAYSMPVKIVRNSPEFTHEVTVLPMVFVLTVAAVPIVILIRRKRR